MGTPRAFPMRAHQQRAPSISSGHVVSLWPTRNTAAGSKPAFLERPAWECCKKKGESCVVHAAPHYQASFIVVSFFFLRLSRFSSLPFSGTLDDTESFRNYYSFTLESKMALQSTVTGTRNRQSGRPYPCLRVDATPFAFSHWATARRHPSFNVVC